MKVGNQAVLLFRLQINQQVAAREKIEPGKGWILDHALDGEYHHLADVFLDLVAAVIFFGEEAAQALRRDILGDNGRITSAARRADGVIVEIGGIDLHPEFLAGLIHILAQQHGD